MFTRMLQHLYVFITSTRTYSRQRQTRYVYKYSIRSKNIHVPVAPAGGSACMPRLPRRTQPHPPLTPQTPHTPNRPSQPPPSRFKGKTQEPPGISVVAARDKGAPGPHEAAAGLLRLCTGVGLGCWSLFVSLLLLFWWGEGEGVGLVKGV